MTPKQTYGLTIAQAVIITGVPRSTLFEWRNTKPKLFHAVMTGAAALSEVKCIT